MKKSINVVAFCCFTLLSVATVRAADSLKTIEEYSVFFANLKKDKEYFIARRFKEAEKNQTYYLAINTNDLSSKVVSADSVRVKRIGRPKIDTNSRYARLIKKSKLHNNHFQGLASSETDKNVLTIDLCPSSRPLDASFFDFLERNAISPVYVCITGKWIAKHLAELDYIKSLKGIDFIWVNHSYTHFYQRDLPNENNFLLSAGTVVEDEVLLNEIEMLKNGLYPSAFFRLPGLIANEALYDKIIGMGLIPLGSNAWLAKDEMPAKGSIILTHGNGNEKQGLELFIRYFEELDLKFDFIK